MSSSSELGFAINTGTFSRATPRDASLSGDRRRLGKLARSSQFVSPSTRVKLKSPVGTITSHARKTSSRPSSLQRSSLVRDCQCTDGHVDGSGILRDPCSLRVAGLFRVERVLAQEAGGAG